VFNVGTEKLVLILLVGLVVLGPDQLAATARKVGNMVNELRRLAGGVDDRTPPRVG